MLRKGEVNFVERRKGNSRVMMASDKQRMYRIRKKAQKTIEDLTYLAQNLPEKQLKQIFNGDTLTPLFKAIFHKADADKRRIRKIILPLIAEVLGDRDFVLRIIPEDARRLISNTDNPIELVEGLFFASMYSE
jgi:predicted NAD/FAD-binding protein